MMRGTLAELLPEIAGAALGADARFEGVSTDSRNIAPGQLFVALRGEQFDGHRFLDQVAARGAAAAVVEQAPAGVPLPFLTVPDTRAALGAIARHWRRQFAIPVIGVTGSNGKTTVKEMIAAILAAAFGAEAILATRGNLNNEVGVPLTLFRLQAGCRAAVVEMGMNHPGEIGVLAAIALPTVALVNNAQREHQEFMASVEAVAQENGSVIRGLAQDGTAVFPADDPYTPLWRGYAGARRALTFGFGTGADVTCSHRPDEFGSALEVAIGAQRFAARIAAAGLHNVRNALAAIACTHAIGIAPEAIARGLAAFAPVSGRLQQKTAKNGARLIDDTYNANPDSVRAAIDVLAQAPAPRLLVLGDMGEVGDEGPRFHQEIGAYARQRGIENLLTLGRLARDAALAFGPPAAHFEELAALLRAIDDLVTPGASVLVKGSRFMKMERVVQHLSAQAPFPDSGTH
jgi:UDP-N-acetylmuramoyl-tripeptide--D-alanyl-D-alanine ligase